MPRKKVTLVYQFDELSDAAKKTAREWWREGAQDYEWWDYIFDDAKQCLALAGFLVKDIMFQGFSSQGDGACFTGSWYATDAKPVAEMKAHAPQDEELHRIATRMHEIAEAHPEAAAIVKHSGRDVHSGCTRFEIDGDVPDEVQEAIINTSRDAMDWIYRQLEKEYEWLNSDEQVDEAIRANEYEFTEGGARA